MSSYSTLQLDALKEIGNIGSGNAATSLSTLLGVPTDLEVSEIEFLSVQQCTERHHILKPEKYSVIYKVEGDLAGFLWFVIKQEDCRHISHILANGMDVSDNHVMSEVTNILGGTYLGALGDMAGMRISLDPPQETTIENFLENNESHQIDQDNILFIKNTLTVENRPVNCYIHLVLEDPSLRALFGKFGL